ncbi:MAG: DUF362 domain-containing protein, partial [Candidatus Margulisiibacteriota bacterium]
KPRNVAPIAKKISLLGGKPFLTDANTLYKGTRGNSVDHIKTALSHGYCFAPVIIADGLTGKSFQEVEVNLKHFKKVKIGSEIMHADAMIVMSHFKGHELTGFGGAIKNVGMGLGSRAGKQQMHADVHPSVDPDLCTGCELCVKWCPTEAISMIDGKAVIDAVKCIGCAECIVTCNFSAISIEWSGSSTSVQEKMVEYFSGAVKGKKCAYISFIVDVSPNCDCWNFNGEPIVGDVGVLASYDPVAVDQACVDLVNKKAGTDIIKKTWPELDSSIQLEYARQIGLGSRKYELCPIC